MAQGVDILAPMWYNIGTMSRSRVRGEKPYKRRRRLALITVVDYLTKINRAASTEELQKVLEEHGMSIPIRTLQRWLKRWTQDNKYTSIKCVYRKKWQPYLYTSYRCHDTKSYERIVHMADRYMGA